MIKKEARILGVAISTGKRKIVPVIGVVYRGNLWLDGIITCQFPSKEPGYLPTLVQAIERSRQYSQIHAVFLHEEDITPETQISIQGFSRKIDLPVISIIKQTKHPKTTSYHKAQAAKVEYFVFKIANKLVHVRVCGMSLEETQDIFAVACSNGQSIPEAVRVAEVLAKNLPSSTFFQKAK